MWRIILGLLAAVLVVGCGKGTNCDTLNKVELNYVAHLIGVGKLATSGVQCMKPDGRVEVHLSYSDGSSASYIELAGGRWVRTHTHTYTVSIE